MGKRGIKTPLGKRQRVHLLINPKVLEATDAIAEICNVSRTEIIELGLTKVFENFIEFFSENGVGE